MAMTFDDFQRLTSGIKGGVERVERLNALREHLVRASEIILSEEVQKLVGVEGAEYFEELQAPLENLIYVVESEIACEKKGVDSDYYGLLSGVWSLAREMESLDCGTRGDLTGDYSYLDAE